MVCPDPFKIVLNKIKEFLLPNDSLALFCLLGYKTKDFLR